MQGALEALLVLSIACTSPVQPTIVQAGTPFTVNAGRVVYLESGLVITFDVVTADSRCPIDAICVSAGDATVHLLLEQGGTRGDRDLHTSLLESSTATFLAYSIRLLELQPYPRSSSPTRPADYVATLRVDPL